VASGEEDIHAYDLSQLQKPIDSDIDSVAASVKKWPDVSLTRPGHHRLQIKKLLDHITYGRK